VASGWRNQESRLQLVAGVLSGVRAGIFERGVDGGFGSELEASGWGNPDGRTWLSCSFSCSGWMPAIVSGWRSGQASGRVASSSRVFILSFLMRLLCNSRVKGLEGRDWEMGL